MRAAASPQVQEWIDGFLFVANRPILDLLNTKPVLADGPTELLPDVRALERWLIASGTVTSAKAKTTLRSWRNSAEARSLPEAAHRLPGKTAGDRSSHGARTRTRRYLPSPSEFIVDATSSPRVTPQTRRKGHSRDIVRASPASRPLGPHHRTPPQIFLRNQTDRASACANPASFTSLTPAKRAHAAGAA